MTWVLCSTNLVRGRSFLVGHSAGGPVGRLAVSRNPCRAVGAVLLADDV